MIMSQPLRDFQQNSIALWDEFGWINWLLFPLKSGGLGVNWFAQILFHGGTEFCDNPLLEPTFLLVFLFDFPWYKKILRIMTYMILIFGLILTYILVFQVRDLTWINTHHMWYCYNYVIIFVKIFMVLSLQNKLIIITFL